MPDGNRVPLLFFAENFMYEDTFKSFSNSPISPAEVCFAIVPADTGNLPQATKAIYVGTGGTVNLVSVGGAAPVSFVNIQDGTILDIRTRAVYATGTTASNLVGLA